MKLSLDQAINQGSLSRRHIFQLAMPILLAMLMEQVIGLSDVAFLGRIGEVELGAAALGGVYYLAFFMLGCGFSIGSQILIARRNGEGKFLRIGKIFYTSMCFLFGFAALVIGLSRWGTPLLMKHFVQSEEVYEATLRYLDYRIWGLLFAYGSAQFRAFFVGVTQTRILSWNSLVMVGTNLLLNYALIFGKMGMPEMGIAGAALASTASEAVSLLFYALYMQFKVNRHKYYLNQMQKSLNWHILMRVFRLGGWTMLQLFLAVAVWFYFFVAVEHLGEQSLAIINIIRSVSAIFFLIIHAFATAGSSLVSNLIGAGHRDRVIALAWRVTECGFLAMALPLLVVGVIPGIVLQIYTNQTVLIDGAIPVIYVMIAAHLLQLPAHIWFSVISGTGNTRMACGIEALTLVIYAVAVWYLILVLRCSVTMSWTTEILYQLVMALLCFLYMYKGNWTARKI